MKKKFFAAVLAILTAAAMTACGGSGNSAEVTDETTSAAVTREESPAETEADSETKTETETETDTETAAQDGENLHKGDGYTVKVDSAKWMDGSDYMKMISEYVEDVDIGMDLTAEDIQNMNDGMFYHTNEDGTNFNIVCNAVGNTDGISIADGAEFMKEQYAAAGMSWTDSELVEINGIEWLKINVETSMQGTNMKMLQCMALANGNQYILTYTANTDKYDSSMADFEEVLNSFRLTD